MMGYTHVAVGAAGAVGLAASAGFTTPEAYILAASFGALGGAAPDIDVDNHFSHPTMTDGIRTMIACLGMMALSVVLDLVLKIGIMSTIVTEKYTAIGGLIVFIILMGIGHFTEHRTFTHSLLFTVLTTICIGVVKADAAPYYLVGCALHIILDLFNKKYHSHGVRLLYPLKIGNGIAFGLCKSDKAANKALYFIGLVCFVAVTIHFIMQIGSITKSIAPIAILVYMVIVMHFVREKSERELRCLMHIHGEL